MSDQSPQPAPAPRRKAARAPVQADTPRAARLKAALKANIARRKAQAEARADDANPKD